MELFNFFQTSEFIAALFGVVAGFFFTLLSDIGRAWVGRAVKRRQIKQEVKMIYQESINSLVVHIENDKIKKGSKEAPLMCRKFDMTITDDKGLMLDAGLSMEKRQLLLSIANVANAIAIESDRMSEKVLEYSPKIAWESKNTNICHYFAFIVFNCDQYFGKIRQDFKDPLNGSQFRERNERVLLAVEDRHALKIPRDLPASSAEPR